MKQGKYVSLEQICVAQVAKHWKRVIYSANTDIPFKVQGFVSPTVFKTISWVKRKKFIPNFFFYMAKNKSSFLRLAHFSQQFFKYKDTFRNLWGCWSGLPHTPFRRADFKRHSHALCSFIIWRLIFPFLKYIFCFVKLHAVFFQKRLSSYRMVCKEQKPTSPNPSIFLHLKHTPPKPMCFSAPFCANCHRLYHQDCKPGMFSVVKPNQEHSHVNPDGRELETEISVLLVFRSLTWWCLLNSSRGMTYLYIEEEKYSSKMLMTYEQHWILSELTLRMEMRREFAFSCLLAKVKIHPWSYSFANAFEVIR